MTVEKLRSQVDRIVAERFPDADAVFWAGSLSRDGDGTPYSDIDLVVVYERLDNAWRETFTDDGRTVETFVHDPDSLRFFGAREIAQRLPILTTMVAEGVILTDRGTAQELQGIARNALARGPSPPDADDIEHYRYAANNLMDDLKGANDPSEIRAIGMTLFLQASEFLRLSQGRWSARGKHLVRTLRAEEGQLGADFLAAFDRLFSEAEVDDAIDVVERVYAPYGGPLLCWKNLGPPHRQD